MKKFVSIVISIFMVMIFFCITAGCEKEEVDPVEYKLETSELPFRDVCVLADKKTNRYYMVGFQKKASSAQQVVCYQSKDLKMWGGRTVALENDSEYNDSWAPELWQYKGGYYMFATLSIASNLGDKKACYILKADKPNGPYTMHSERLTTSKLSCIDGTLYVQDGVPYMVYSEEWIPNEEVPNGKMTLVKLKDDLTGIDTSYEPRVIFTALDNTMSADPITDGPWLYKAKNGELVMLWSKYKNNKYTIIQARSQNGIEGPWTHDVEPLFSDDGGHAMIFEDFSGNLKIAFHDRSQNKGNERPVIYDFIDNNGVLFITTEN